MNSSTRPVPLQISANFLSKLVRQRHLVWNFARRDLKSRYVGSLIGFFWSVIHPLVLLACYTFVFSIIFDIRPRSQTTDNFAVFLFCGILPWLFFQDSVLRSCACVVENGNLIRKTVFPSEILPLSLVLSNLVYHCVGLGILVLLLIWLELIQWTMIFLPVYLFGLIAFCLGIGWLVAALQVFLRDTMQVLTVVMVFWFWLTPIFYTVGQVPEFYQPLIALNPLAVVVEGYRMSLLEGSTPNVQDLALLLLEAGGIFLLGGVVFRNTKREFVDVL